MIKKLRLLNYKKIKAQEISFGWINVFLGANGAGKSTVTTAIFAMGTIIRLGLKATFPEGLYSFNNIINFDQEKFGYRFRPHS